MTRNSMKLVDYGKNKLGQGRARHHTIVLQSVSYQTWEEWRVQLTKYFDAQTHVSDRNLVQVSSISWSSLMTKVLAGLFFATTNPEKPLPEMKCYPF